MSSTSLIDELLQVGESSEKKKNKEVKQKDREIPNREDFKVIETNLNSDLIHTDNRMAQIQAYITSIEGQISHLKTIIKSENDPNKRGKLYGVLNECMSLASTFEDLYIKALNTKHKFRKEQIEFSLRKARYLEIELPKALRDQDSGEDDSMNLSKLIRELNKLDSANKSSTIISKPKQISDSTVDVDVNDLRYKL